MTRDVETRSSGHRVFVAVVGRLGAWLLRVWAATWRVTTEGPDPLVPDHGPVVAAFWHENILMASWYYRDRDFGVAVSRSRDGDLIAALLHALGYRRAARGSSSRGGAAALRDLYRQVESGVTVSLQTDGPQGPARVSKTGVVTLARLAGRPIQPVAFRASPAYRFASWDETILPLPFARVSCRYADPIPVDRDANDDVEEAVRQHLDGVLNTMRGALDG